MSNRPSLFSFINVETYWNQSCKKKQKAPVESSENAVLIARIGNKMHLHLQMFVNVHLTSSELIRYECVLSNESSDWQFCLVFFHSRMMMKMHQVDGHAFFSLSFFPVNQEMTSLSQTLTKQLLLNILCVFFQYSGKRNDREFRCILLYQVTTFHKHRIDQKS